MFLYQRTQTENEPDAIKNLASEPSTFIDWGVVGSILAFITLVWVGAIAYAGYKCEQNYNTTCLSQDIIAYSLPTMVIISLISWGFTSFIANYHKAHKERLANALYQHYDYNNAQQLQHILTEKVAYRIAESLATAQLDTLSTTNSHTNSAVKDTPIIPDTKDPLSTAKIAIEDIFNFKED
nr:hypothetical protein [Oscillochloris trichoides]